MLIGTIINCLAVAIGSIIGLTFNRVIPVKITNQLMKALGLCTIFIGVQGAFKGENPLVMVLSVVLGVLLGEAIDIHERFGNLLNRIETRFTKNKKGQTSLAQGFISASLLFCIGSMTLVGALNAGVYGDQSMLLTKSTLDFTSSIVFASTLGIGVLFSVGFVGIFQGGITILASLAAPLLSLATINEMTCAGSIILIGTGLNLLGVTELKLLNYLPAMFMPLLLMLFF